MPDLPCPPPKEENVKIAKVERDYQFEKTESLANEVQ